MGPENNTTPVAPVSPAKPVEPVAPAEPVAPVVPTEEKKASKGMLAGIIILAILAIAGIAFGIWAVLDGNTQKQQLLSKIDALEKANMESAEKWTEDDDTDLNTDSNMGTDDSARPEDELDDSDVIYEGGEEGSSNIVDDNGVNVDVNTITTPDSDDYIYLGKMGIKIKIPQKKNFSLSVEQEPVPGTGNMISTFHIYETRPGGGIVGQIIDSCENVSTGFNNWKCITLGDINVLIAEIGGMYEGTLSDVFWDYFTNSESYSKI